jgi:hypothetical protein
MSSSTFISRQTVISADWCNDVDDHVYGVKGYGAVGDGFTDDTVAIQAAIDAASAAGGGVIYFPPGNYKVRKLNPTGANGSSPDDMALHIQASNITLRGEIGKSRIFADPSVPTRFVTLRVGTIPIVNGGLELTNIKIEGLEFDGSYDPPTTGTEHDDGNMLIWLHGIKRLVLRDLYIHRSSDYGIGIQNGGHKDFRIENVVIEDVMADGIDVKNNGDTDGGNKMINVTVRRFGRSTDLTDPFAGIDIMGPGWELSNIHIEEFNDAGTPNAGIRFKQGEVGDSRGDGGHYGSLTNFYVKVNGSNYSSCAGVKISARDVAVSNGTIRSATAEGVLVEQERVKITNISTIECATGFRTKDSSYTTNADRVSFSSCVALSNTTYGFRIETDNCSLMGCIARSNGTNLSMTAGSTNTRWIGGEISNHVTKAVGNAGTTNLVRDAAGFDTMAQVESSTIDITTTGDKSIAIPHGLPFTPQRQRCQISVLRSNNNVTWVVSRLIIISTDATNVNCRIGISTASGTVGDTATLALSVNSALIPAL